MFLRLRMMWGSLTTVFGKFLVPFPTPSTPNTTASRKGDDKLIKNVINLGQRRNWKNNFEVF